MARTHGGAVAHSVSYELPLRYRSVRHAEEKRRIERRRPSGVGEGVAIGLTGGTTATAGRAQVPIQTQVPVQTLVHQAQSD